LCGGDFMGQVAACLMQTVSTKWKKWMPSTPPDAVRTPQMPSVPPDAVHTQWIPCADQGGRMLSLIKAIAFMFQAHMRRNAYNVAHMTVHDLIDAAIYS
jgi:hypothetical protein